MSDIAKELDTALQMLGTILLSGDAVDVMAAAKSKIRRAKAEIENLGKEDTPDG